MRLEKIGHWIVEVYLLLVYILIGPVTVTMWTLGVVLDVFLCAFFTGLSLRKREQDAKEEKGGNNAD